MKNSGWLVALILAAVLILDRVAPDDATENDRGSSGDVSSQREGKGGGQNSDNFSGKVVRVVDGDSLYVDSRKKQIRLWAVDAPETNEAGYSEAKAMLRRFAMGRVVSCLIKDIDKYGRTVAQCSDENGKDINGALIESGVSNEYCRFSRNYYGNCR